MAIQTYTMLLTFRSYVPLIFLPLFLNMINAATSKKDKARIIGHAKFGILPHHEESSSSRSGGQRMTRIIQQRQQQQQQPVIGTQTSNKPIKTNNRGGEAGYSGRYFEGTPEEKAKRIDEHAIKYCAEAYHFMKSENGNKRIRKKDLRKGANWCEIQADQHENGNMHQVSWLKASLSLRVQALELKNDHDILPSEEQYLTDDGNSSGSRSSSNPSTPKSVRSRSNSPPRNQRSKSPSPESKPAPLYTMKYHQTPEGKLNFDHSSLTSIPADDSFRVHLPSSSSNTSSQTSSNKKKKKKGKRT